MVAVVVAAACGSSRCGGKGTSTWCGTGGGHICKAAAVACSLSPMHTRCGGSSASFFSPVLYPTPAWMRVIQRIHESFHASCIAEFVSWNTLQ